jgi:hypothetical protein
MKTWMVELEGYTPAPFVAATKPKAVYRAFRAYREAYGAVSFRTFLARLRSAREATATDLVLT